MPAFLKQLRDAIDTLVIEPGGKILYRLGGEVSIPELQTKLIDKLGAYYTP